MRLLLLSFFVSIFVPSCDSDSSVANEDVSSESAGEEKLREEQKKAEARQCLVNLVSACEAFFDEYQSFPMATISASDAEQVTDNRLMAPLLGFRVAQDENPKFLTFFEWKVANGTGNSAVGGLVRTEYRAELLDPWGNWYRVMFDYDYDNKLQEPQAVGSSGIILDRKVIAYSLGPDGMAESEGRRDNIYSWVPSKGTFQESEERTSEESRPQISDEQKDGC